MTWSAYDSPLGPLTLVAGEAGLRAVHFPGLAPAMDPAERDPDALRDVRDQLDEYFAGRRQRFELALDLSCVIGAQRGRYGCYDAPIGPSFRSVPRLTLPCGAETRLGRDLVFRR